jgi:hypothetical protein
MGNARGWCKLSFLEEKLCKTRIPHRKLLIWRQVSRIRSCAYSAKLFHVEQFGRGPAKGGGTVHPACDFVAIDLKLFHVEQFGAAGLQRGNCRQMSVSVEYHI